ncbi:MAG: N-6 DNA methylase [Candidatus Aminicenantes bacterium]|nr:N-6 DNA methylase [Candidatus Aminicenantes bacterium]
MNALAEDPKEYSKKTPPELFLLALMDFADSVKAKFDLAGSGEPEDQLRAPLEGLFEAYGRIINREILLTGEHLLKDRVGKPDFAAHDQKQTIGYVEAKAPGKGANPSAFKGHDLEQWHRFQNVPNLFYTDGNDWGLYRSGKREGLIVRFHGDVCSQGRAVVDHEIASSLFQLFAEFSSWTPIVPQKPKDLAEFLAPYCRLIRAEVEEALESPRSPLQSLKKEIKSLLFPEATDRQFADAYAQTVIFALLLAKLEGASVLELKDAYGVLESHHLLLSRSLQFLTDPQAREEIASSLGLTQRVIQEISPETLKSDPGGDDPWLFFYEFFLAKYDPKLRKEWGVYYTPVEVVRCQVRLIDEVLSKELGQTMGFVEPGVVTLDPALGTGTYLLGIIDHALKRVAAEEGPGAVRGGARSLAKNLHGFEWLVGPYAVAQLRFSRALLTKGAALPPAGLGIYLTNTLESPHTHPPAPPLFHKPIAEEHKRALKVKDAEHVLVCLGNPPYGRHEASQEANHSVTGGWIRYGDEKHPPVLEDFLEPVRKAGFGIHLKNLYNQYVYFIRWALWKVFEHESAVGPGVVSFITASSYLDGDAFAGLREHMRRTCDRIDIIDLGGEGRGTRKDENVFAIQTPVAIFVAWRKGKEDSEKPAVVRYTRIEGTRDEKLEKLASIGSTINLTWKKAPSHWQAPFRPEMIGNFMSWPPLTDMMPWQYSGIQVKRSWPIAPNPELLKARWENLLSSQEKKSLFKESGDREVGKAQADLFRPYGTLPPILGLSQGTSPREIIRYAYRSFDRQFILADNRIISRPRPCLFHSHSERQLFLASLFSIPLGSGPALTACSQIPDLDFFRGSYGAKAILPLFRDSAGREPNIAPGLMDNLSRELGRSVTAEDMVGYIYGVLAQPDYTSRFARELGSREIRVPLTKKAGLFFRTAEFGKSLLWLHTYGERLAGENRPKGQIPAGSAKCLSAVSDDEEKYPNEFRYDEDTKTLHVGDGTFGPVESEVYHFEVSGLHVVKSWLGYRMRERSGRKSSLLDDIRPRVWTREFTRELLELLWVLERTLEGYPKQKKLLDEILAGPLFLASDLPPVPSEARDAPRLPRRGSGPQGEFSFNSEDAEEVT